METGIDIRTYSPLALAWLGDAVFSQRVRSALIRQGNTSVNKLNKRANKIVCAKRQSAMIRAIREELTDEERAVYKRGRNAHSHTKAKGATSAEYNHATGLEAVIGFLYLREEEARITELIQLGIERTTKKKEGGNARIEE